MNGLTRYAILPFNEHYECTKPTFCAGNLIIGQMYVDLGGKCNVENKTLGHKAEVEFKRRGWSASSYYKCSAIIKNKDGVVKYKIEGDWSKQFELQNVETGEKEIIWRKSPYHEMADHMYGMTPFAIQLNYFPKRIQGLVAPTDTRRRPD